MPDQDYALLSAKQALEELKSSGQGLGEKEASKRLETYGRNKLAEKRRIHPFKIFFNQFKNFLVLILIFAVLISLAIGHFFDAALIGFILVANALLGFFQEFRAEKALLALKKIQVQKARVLRQGREEIIDASELVPGDIVIIQQGDKVPADGRVVESVNLSTNEAALTGDSWPVDKVSEALKGKVLLAEKKNMVFMNTLVTFGRGKVLVTGTGMQTEFGKIALSLQEIKEEKTPLTERIEGLGKVLGVSIILITLALMLLLFLAKGFELEMVLVAISLAVSAIPEGLPAVVTIALAFGMREMARNKAVVRQIAAVETLGSTTVICSDKTGTLTQNEMTVKVVEVKGKTIEVTGEGYGFEGCFTSEGKVLGQGKCQALYKLLKTGVLCNSSEIDERGEKPVGDPTEIALLVAARKAGIKKHELKERFVDELPFDSDRKRMTVIYEDVKGKRTAYCKGSVEAVLAKSSHIQIDGKRQALTPKLKKELLARNNELAGQGLRVLGFAFKEETGRGKYKAEEVEKGLTFLGLAGMADSLRPESKQAVELCQQAGIQVKMITGDHPLTAVAIARQLGLVEEEEIPRHKVITGYELEEMTDETLDSRVKEIAVFARVTPQHKLRVVESLKRIGEVVAVTGDGVNDAPALKTADLGVAMGISGTDVAKEASAMVILDDNFATIVKAVEQGRKVYANIKAYIKYTLAGNIDEIIVIAGATLVGLPLPLLPVQILTINLMTDGLPALALSNEPLRREAMKEKPRNPKESILHGMKAFTVFAGVVAAAATFTGFLIGLGDSVTKARTMAFAVCVFFEMIFVFNCRQKRKSMFEVPFLSNPYLVAAVALTLAMLYAVIQLPFLQAFFYTTGLSLGEWAMVAGLSLTAALVPFLDRIWHKLK